MKTKKILFIAIFIFIFFSQSIIAQSPNWQWAKGIGGSGHEYCNSVAVDANGNVYSIGSFNGTVDFDPNLAISNLTSVGIDDIFISKIDGSGNYIWTKSIGSSQIDEGFSITLDNSGNVYSTGSFTGTVDFDPGVDTFNLVSSGSENIFISKLDNNGNFIWAKPIFGYGNKSHSIATDNFNNVYAAGQFEGTVDFDPSTNIFNLTSSVYDGVFILKLDSNGSFLSAKGISGTNAVFDPSIAIDDNNNVYATGILKGTADFNPGGGVFNLTSNGDNDIFIFKLSSNGNFVWAKEFGGAWPDEGNSIALDDSGNIYTTGRYGLIADFDPNSDTFNLTTSAMTEIFISKLDNSGNFIWAKSMGGIGVGIGFSIAVDDSGFVYTTGNYSETKDFDPDTSASFNLTSNGNLDIFISKLDESGNFISAKSIGGSADDYCMSIVSDNSDNIYFGGYFFSSTITFNPFTLTNAGHTDLFISKFGFPSNGIENIFNKYNITIYPNPTTDKLTIELPSGISPHQIEITDALGRKIYTEKTNLKSVIINLKSFHSGIYFIKVKMEDGSVTVRKFVKE